MAYTRTHTTREGDTLTLPEMSTSHISNFLRQIMREAHDLRNRMADVDSGTPIQIAMRKANGRAPVSPDTVVAALLTAEERMAPYIMELMLRGATDVAAEWTSTLAGLMDRTPALPAPEPEEIELPIGVGSGRFAAITGQAASK